MRSTQCFGAEEVPRTAKRNASANVDFPLPRGPIIRVRPRGMLTLKAGRNPPLISIFSTSHIGPTSIEPQLERYCYQHIAGILSVRHRNRIGSLRHCISIEKSAYRQCAVVGSPCSTPGMAGSEALEFGTGCSRLLSRWWPVHLALKGRPS